MSEIKPLRLAGDTNSELSAKLKKHLQNHIEANLDPLIGVSYFASEYNAGKTNAGSIEWQRTRPICIV
ncbi:MAG: hypothetical protein LAT61_09850 [Alcanivorax sp.]|nr:hypothetical protein [Alcanivorax sp.]